MDLIDGLSMSKKKHDRVWVVVDRLTKVAHFLGVRSTNSVKELAQIYLDGVVKYHGAPESVTTDRGTKFTSKLWKEVQKAFGTKSNFSTAFHPQTDGQTERVNQILEDMLLYVGIWWELGRSPISH